jgi:hypothetical protein
VIFDDVYGVTSSDVQRPLASPESLLPGIRNSLAEGGTFAANLVIGPGHRKVQTGFRHFFRVNFPEIRSITTEDSLNECLVGGHLLRPWNDIRPFAKCFPSNTDYSFWRRLKARRLPTLAPTG